MKLTPFLVLVVFLFNSRLIAEVFDKPPLAEKTSFKGEIAAVFVIESGESCGKTMIRKIEKQKSIPTVFIVLFSDLNEKVRREITKCALFSSPLIPSGLQVDDLVEQDYVCIKLTKPSLIGFNFEPSVSLELKDYQPSFSVIEGQEGYLKLIYGGKIIDEGRVSKLNNDDQK
jgi:hypothetical protein